MTPSPMSLLGTPTGSEWIHFLLILLGLGSFVALAELVRKAFRWSPEVTRKLVHIATGILIYFAPALFASGIPAILLAVVFIVINFSAVRFGLLKGMHGTNRRSYGTVYYPLSFLILVLVFWESAPSIISISILVLGLSDAAAAIVGENLRAPHNYNLTSDKKSVEGSLAMFVVTFLIIVVFLASVELKVNSVLGLGPGLLIALCVSLFATAWEALSSRGLDNLTIPLSVAFVLHFFLVPLPHHHAEQFFSGIGFAALVALASYYFRFLSSSGGVATFLLATVIFGIGGWQWGIPILAFFVLSSLLSKSGKRKKAEHELFFEKTDKRDIGQVAANGGVGGIVVLCWYVLPGLSIWYPIYLASLAAVTADTWGTEIGLLAKGRPRSIITFREAEKGTSGAISLTGLIGGTVGALVIALTGSLWSSGLHRAVDIGAVTLCGLFGSVVDSLLGATWQAQYRCTVCGKRTERTLHCGAPSQLTSGFVWLNNDIVNWCCAAAGALGYALIASW